MNAVMIMVANVTLQDAVAALQAVGIGATIHSSVGVGAWGIEHGVTVILDADYVARAYRAIEAATGIDEKAIYVIDLGVEGKVVATTDLPHKGA